MSKINLLDSSVYNYISAGQVISSPVDVVKELVDNSIDAGAQKIVVEIEKAGLKCIKVFDDGSGIEKDDVKKAFMVHATSKINSKEDVFNICTLGFRGEALASIAEVSNVSMTTRTAIDTIGTHVEIRAGEFVEFSEKAFVVGTMISVENLFMNTPVKKKFLHSNVLEQAEINQCMAEFVLANPFIEFVYLIDGEVRFHSSGKNLYDAIYTVFGSEYLENAIEIETTIKDNYCIHGYVSYLPKRKVSNRYTINVVNGRCIKNDTIYSAVCNAYMEFTMLDTEVVYVLHITVPPNELDVNITPKKTQVKFQNNTKLYTFINGSLNTKFAEVRRIDAEESSKQKLMEAAQIFRAEEVPKTDIIGKSFYENEDIENSPQKIVIKPLHIDNGISEEFDEVQQLESNSDLYMKIINSANNSVEPLTSEANILGYKESIQETMGIEKFGRIGTLFNTYIMLQSSDELLLIDQHAAHERMLYDEFQRDLEMKKMQKQDLLIPYVISVGIIESGFLKENLDKIIDMGFEIEEFGVNTFKICAVPLIFSDINLETFFNSLFEDMNYLKKNSDEIRDKIALKACKSAVKAGQSLSVNEITFLLEQIGRANSPLLCPHGRPYTHFINKTEVEKWFKRIR